MPAVVPSAGASIAQRLDCLPLTWALWRLALITQAGWGLVIATDAIAARIYPFVWGPRHAFGTAAFSFLLLISTGVGIVVGEYLFALLADRFGRRPTLLVAAAACGLGTLPGAERLLSLFEAGTADAVRTVSESSQVPASDLEAAIVLPPPDA